MSITGATEQMALLQIESTEISNRRLAISTKKKSLEAELSALNSRVRAATTHRTRLSPEDYRAVCLKQATIKRKLFELEAESASMKARLRDISDNQTLLRLDQGEPLSGVGQRPSVNGGGFAVCQELEKIRGKWLAFAEDPTRVNSMRVMAAQFSRELTDVLSTFSLFEQPKP